jgi:hypothetical protein
VGCLGNKSWFGGEMRSVGKLGFTLNWDSWLTKNNRDFRLEEESVKERAGIEDGDHC